MLNLICSNCVSRLQTPDCMRHICQLCSLQCRDLCYHYYHYSYFAAEAPAKLSLLPEIRGNVAFVLVRSFTVELC